MEADNIPPPAIINEKVVEIANERFGLKKLPELGNPGLYYSLSINIFLLHPRLEDVRGNLWESEAIHDAWDRGNRMMMIRDQVFCVGNIVRYFIYVTARHFFPCAGNARFSLLLNP